jgi:hypothetical protein
LTLIEDGIAEAGDFVDLKPRQARAVTEQTKRVMRETKDPKKAKVVVKHLSEGMRSSSGVKTKERGSKHAPKDVTIHNAKLKADMVLARAAESRRCTKSVEPKKLSPIDIFAERVITALAKVFFDHRDKLKALVEHREHLHKRKRDMMIKVLLRMATDAEDWAKKLESE